MRRIEKYNAVKSGNLDKHIAKWYNVNMRNNTSVDEIIQDDFVSDYIERIDI